MTIIVHGLEAPASVRAASGGLAIRFADPAYIRSEQVLVDRQSRRVGVVFEQGYHDLGVLPVDVVLDGLTMAQLSGDAHGLSLCAPIKVN